MPSASRIVISAAGGGKTTRVVSQALAADQGRATALITYTRNNVREIHSKVYEQAPAVPSNVEIISWYSFLLKELARPYRSAMHNRRIEGIFWVEKQSAPYVPESRTSAHYFANGSLIYSDKIAKFICACNARSGGAIIRRLKARYGHIIVDEIQDMAGYDLDLLELFLKSGIPVTLVGDHRQATFTTNNAAKNKAFCGPAIIKKFEQWKTAGLIAIDFECHTHRCNQTIANLADSLFPNEPKTVSSNADKTGHDGIFLVRSGDINSYMLKYAPQVLRYSAKTKIDGGKVLNFGEAKGLTFDRVLIYPHKKADAWIASGGISHVEKTVSKMYVAVTRARHSVAFVFDGKTCGIAADWWSIESSQEV